MFLAAMMTNRILGKMSLRHCILGIIFGYSFVVVGVRDMKIVLLLMDFF